MGRFGDRAEAVQQAPRASRFGERAEPIRSRFANAAEPVERSFLDDEPAPPAQPPKRDTWGELGRKLIANAGTMFKQAAGGTGQALYEMPSGSGAQSDERYAREDARIKQRVLERARAPGGGGIPGEALYREATAELLANAPNVDPDSAKAYAYDIAQGIIQMGPAIAASLATRSPGVGATIIGGQVAGPRFGESRAAGRTAEESAADALFYGLAEGIPEKVPLGFLMKPGGRFLSRVFKTAGAEAAQETMTEALQMGYDAGALDEETPWEEVPGRLARAGIIGAGVGGGLAAAAHPFVPRETETKPGAPSSDPARPDGERMPGERTAQEVSQFGIERRSELEARPNLAPAEQQELDFLRTEAANPEKIAGAYGWRIRDDGPKLTKADIESPIPNELILKGRQILEDALNQPPAEIPDARASDRPGADSVISDAPPGGVAPLGGARGGLEQPLPGSAPAKDPAVEGALADEEAAEGSVAPARPTGADAVTAPPAAGGATTSLSQESVAPATDGAARAQALRGEKIDAEWTKFAPDSGTLNVPRDQMPQIKAEHRGAMVNFLEARGVTHEQTIDVPASSLKPTQAELSEAKVQQAREFEGGNRSILISADGHVLDGHHQWLAALEKGETVPVIRLNAPIRDLLQVVPEFPSNEGGTEPVAVAATTAAPSADQQVTTQAEAETTVNPPKYAVESYTEKSVIVRGSSRDDARVQNALPGKSALWNAKAKGWVFSKKHEAALRKALGVDAPATPEKPGAPDTVQIRTIRIGMRDGTISESTSEEPREPADKKALITRAEATQLFEETKRRMPADYAVAPFDREIKLRTPKESIPWVGDWRRLTKAELSREFDRMVDEARRRSDQGVDRKPVTPQVESPAGSTPLGVKPKGQRELGQNRYGQRIYEDENGVRSYADGGVRVTEPVSMVPTREGIKTSINPSSREDRFLTTEEHRAKLSGSAPSAPPADQRVTPNKVFTEDAAAKARALLKSKLSSAQTGIDPEVLQAGITLAGYHIEKGARTFAAYSKAMIEDLGDAIRPYLKSFYMAVKYDPRAASFEGMDDAATVDSADTAAPAEAPAAPMSMTQALAAAPEVVRLARDFSQAFMDGQPFPSIVQARRYASDLLGREIKAGTADAKMVDEAIELGAVLWGRSLVATSATPKEAYRKLVALYGQMPNLGTRTSTSVAEQAYSTPLPLAYLGAQLAGITPKTSVYEPSAGNGALLITADPALVTANEINADRAANLKATLPKANIRQKDAADWKPTGKFAVVIGNPPFGIVKDERGETRRFQVDDRYETGEIDHAISLKALEAMKDDGSAVLIVGSLNKLKQTEEARSDGYNTKAKREFYLTLYGQYNVVDHFTVPGELYEKQGAGWPVDVIVIRGRGKSKLKVPAAQVPRQYESWESLEGVLDARYDAAASADRPADRGGNLGERGPRSDDGRAGTGSGERRPDRQRDIAAPGRPLGVLSRPVERQPSGEREAEPPAVPTDPGADQGPVRRPRRSAPVTVEGENARQVAYVPASSVGAMGTLVPVNMQASVQRALKTLEARVGSTDDFVAERLGYKPDELPTYFAAEQLDALALALDNMERGAGFIIGDQTGIGKGRVVAGIIRYAIRTNRTPIFVTEKQGLYGDMYRDLTDIGIQKMLGREPEIVMTNANEKVPLDDDGEKVLKTPAAGIHNKRLTNMAEAGKLDGDMIFSTYTQMQTIKGDATDRQRFLDAMAPGAIVIFDESHTAGGTAVEGEQKRKSKTKKDPITRASFARELAAKAHGVFFSSATYAKRPEVMDLYASTDMRLAVADIKNLAAAIKKGGVPMQQVVASMLAGAGQYIRRERSFDGVNYNAPVVSVSRKTYSQYSTVLAGIQKFSETYIKAAVKNIDKGLKAEGLSVGHDGSTGGAGASSTSFSSVMHNLIDQMLLSITADAAADKAIEALKNNEKPVITLANTMGSAIKDYVAMVGAKPGDRLAMDFASLLQRYLDRTRRITIRKPFMKAGESAEQHYLTDEELGPTAVRAFEAVRSLIESMDFSGLPVSPIDHIRRRIADAGYKVGEITGRHDTIDYRADGPYYRSRPTSETSTAAKRKTIAGFNSGKLDALIINRSGSTGLSLHASSKFKDQRKRRMILAQAEANIDTHMQMLGRVHRTGQVVPPEYDQLVADVPAIKRPAAVLAKKMASLNANTTASRGGALMAENVPDFMNTYGDEVAARVMSDMPEIFDALSEPLKEDEDGYEKTDAMRKVTGRIPLLPVEQQEMLYQVLESEYAELIAQKEAAGESTLEAKTLPLDARVTERSQVVAPRGGDSPFAEGVNVEKVSVKRLGKPFKTEQVMQMLADELKVDRAELGNDLDTAIEYGVGAADEVYQRAIAEFEAYRTETLDELISPEGRKATEERLEGVRNRWTELLNLAVVGQPVRLENNNGHQYGVVTKVERKQGAKNPLALSAWKVTFAMADSSRRLTLSMSQLDTAEPAGEIYLRTVIRKSPMLLDDLSVLEAFDVLQTETREDRTMITGNLLAGYEHVNGRGSIVNFTYEDGTTAPGILMPRGYDYAKVQANKPVPLRTAEQVMAFLPHGVVTSSEEAIGVKSWGDGVRFEVVAAKGKGGRYYLNKDVLRALGRDFVTVGNDMRADVSVGQAPAVIEALIRAGAVFRATSNLEIARKIAGEVGAAAEPQAGDDEAFDLGFFSALRSAAEGLKQEKGTGEQMLAMLKKTPGVKEDELEWTGLGDYLKARPTATKAEILAFLDQNGVKVEEVTIGGASTTARAANIEVELDARGYDVDTDMDGQVVGLTNRREVGTANVAYAWDEGGSQFVNVEGDPLPDDIAAIANRLMQARQEEFESGEGQAQFEQWTLPGGENYREVLLSLPDKPATGRPEPLTELPPEYEVRKRKIDDPKAKAGDWAVYLKEGVGSAIGVARGDTREEAIAAALIEVNRQRVAEWEFDRRMGDFNEGHYDVPNVLAHVRLKDRTSAGGKKVLFVEEIQSDWAQKGRKKGFKGPPPTPEREAEIRDRLQAIAIERSRLLRGSAADTALYEEAERLFDEGPASRNVPRGPFVESTDAWAGLAIKRVIRMAVDGGYDAVAWTTGEQQAERYDLSKQIASVTWWDNLDRPSKAWTPGVGVLRADDHNGRRVLDVHIKPEEIEDHVGKDVAKKLLDSTPRRMDGNFDERSLTGLDLKVGGEGMIGFYDGIVPKLVNNFLKKLGGGRVETLSMPYMADTRKMTFEEVSKMTDTQSQPGFEITPALRERVSQGLPLFSLTPAARAKFDATMVDLRKRLEQVGISDRIALKLRDVIQDRDGTPIPAARGKYAMVQRTIEIAMRTENKRHTLDHEIIHALKDLGVIRDAEWRTLTDKALADKPLMTMIRQRYASRNLSEAKLIEEAIADMHANWADGKFAATGFIRTAFERIREFLEALRNAFRGQGFQSAESIFRAIDRGEIGARPSFARGGFKQSAAEPADLRKNVVAPRQLLLRQFEQVRKQLDALHQKPQPGTVDDVTAEDIAARRAHEAEVRKLTERLNDLAEQLQKDSAFELGDRPTFDPKRAAAIQRGEPPTFTNPESEKRWQEARKGVGAADNWLTKAQAGAERIRNGFTRHWINLPNEPRFSQAQQQLRKIEAAPQASKEEVIRTLKTITEGMSGADLDLFTRKAVLDDLNFEVENQHALPFGFTPGDVQAELVKLDEVMKARPDLARKIELRRELSKKIANDLVRWGVLHKEQIKNPAYYRHQVLDYARAQVAYAKGAGKKLKTPHWARRMGSTLDINANLLEAEFEWMQKALTDVAIARTIDWFKRSEYNVRDQAVANAKAHNDRLVQKALAKDLADHPYTRANGKTSSPLNDEWMGFKQRIAYGLKLVREALDSGQLADIPPEFAATVANLTSETQGEGNLFPFLAWMLDNNMPGSMGAAMAFKAVNQRKAWVRGQLGERYADPMDIEGLVRRGFAPEGYKTWQPDEGLLLFTAKTIPEHVMDRMLKRVADEAAGPVPREELAGALESVRSMLAVGGPKYQMVLPGELADTLSNLKDTEADGMFDAVAAIPMRMWKRWVLINPRRVVKYNLNNLSGDLDAVIAGNPKALKKLPQAIKELRAVMLNGKTPSERYREAVERGVFDSGLTVQEIPDIKFLSEFEHLTDRSLSQKLLTPVAKTWQALQRYTQFRENWIRYAAYLDYVERLEAGEDMRSIGYGASNRTMVDEVTDHKDRAALLARDLVGDYGAISHFGKTLRRKVIPFWSWNEINFKRYWRLIGNGWEQGIGSGFRTTGVVGATLGVKTTAYLALRMFAVYAGIQLWNNLVHGDEEDELSAEERARLHVILGRGPNGEVVTMRLQGALSDFLAWFGFNDAVGMISEVEKGRASVGDVLIAMGKAPVNKITSGLTPVITAPVEAATGKKIWPDVFEPRQIRDKWRNVAQLFSMEHEYDLIFDRPSRGYGRSLLESVAYARDPGENAYNRMKGLAYDWEERETGQGGGGGYQTPRSKALYEWRQAQKFGDEEAEAKALTKLRELGVQNQSLRQSIRTAHPLGNIALRDRARFVQSLTTEERDALRQAVEWYEETYLD